jgi:sigma-B regulation protein RsbU (phosphoserine phosphatase)
MGIRSKFLTLLLVFSILPLLVFLLFHQHVYQAVGQDIYEIARLLLFQTAARELQITARNHGDNIRREMNAVAALINAHLKGFEGLTVVPLSERGDTAGIMSVGRLQHSMAAAYNDVVNLHNSLLVLKISLPDGTSIRYPADGRWEADTTTSNASPSIWEEANSKTSVWLWPDGIGGPQMEDPEILTLFLHLRPQDETSLAFITAAFDVLTLLEATRPSSQWSPYMRTGLLRITPKADHARKPPLIIAVREPSPKGPQWQVARLPLVTAANNSETLGKLLQGSLYGSEGYVSLQFEDEAMLISYAEVDKALGIVNLLPEREVLYRIARHPRRLGRWLTLDSVLAAGAVVVVMVLLAVHRSRRMLDPFFAMMSAFKNVSEGHFTTRLTFKAMDERRMVAGAFNQMVADLEEGFRTRQALEVAREVQHNLLPETEIERSGLDIAARIQYCDETGGDYIDILEGKEARVSVVVGDVTGHGIGAALLMATVRALIRGSYPVMDDPAGLMDGVNRNLCADMGATGRFVTLFLLEINIVTREMTWVRAGHDPAWLYRAATGDIRPLGGQGVALGVERAYRFEVNRGMRMAPGDIVLIGTDGIWEAVGPEGDFFGKDRIETVLSKNAGLSATEIGEALMAAVDGFRQHLRLADDVSLVVVKN